MSFKADWLTKSAPIALEAKHDCLNFDKIIKKQQLIIESLGKEIQLLRKILNLSQQTHNQKFFEFFSIPDTNAANLNEVFKQISELVGLAPLKPQNCEILVNAVKKLKETASKQAEPIFIENVKEVKVPFSVERIVYVYRAEGHDPEIRERQEPKKEVNNFLNTSLKQDVREREVKAEKNQWKSKNETAKFFEKRGDNQGRLHYTQKKP